MTIISETNVPERLLKADDGVWWDAGNGVLRGYAETGDQPYKQTLSDSTPATPSTSSIQHHHRRPRLVARARRPEHIGGSLRRTWL